MRRAALLLFIVWTALSNFLHAVEAPIVQELQRELKENYLPYLQDHLGQCDSLDEECLSRQDGAQVLRTQEGDVCFPYTDCEYYKCMERKYQCMPEGVNYFEELAHPTCENYVSRIKDDKFTKEGVEWIYSVMVCLQKGLTQECDVDNNCQQANPKAVCEHITEFTLEFHPGCYIESGVGVCNLPLRDKFAIWKTVSPFLTARERREAFRVVFYCLAN